MTQDRVRRLRAILALAALALAARLVFGDDPWTGGIAEREAEGHPLRPVDFARTWRWWASAAGLVATGFALATARRWLGPSEPVVRPDLAPSPRPPWLVPALVAAMLAAALGAAPRLDHSLWDDEEYTARKAVHGYYREGPDGDPSFLAVRWRDTFLYNLGRPNNHVPFSVLARISVGAWESLTRPSWRHVDERALRLPAYVAGILAVGALGALVARLGSARAGVFAAWLLAFHPWLLRYASEARGYAQALLLVPLVLLGAIAVLRRGSWRRWLAFGAAEAALLWTYPGCVAFLLLVNAGLVAELARAHGRSPDGRQQATRWLVSGVAAGVVFGLLMAPNLAIFLLHTESTREVLKSRFWLDTASHLWSGMAWTHGGRGEPYVELGDVARAAPLLFRAMLGVSVLGLVAGALRLVAAGGIRAWLVPALLLPGLLTALGVVARESLVHEWYFLFALPGLAALLALGLEAPFARAGAGTRASGVAVAFLAAYLAGYAWLTHDMRASLRAHPVQPLRDVVRLERPVSDPFDPANAEILTASWGLTPRYYDPMLHFVGKPEALEALMRDADTTGRPLFISIGRPSLARKRHRELWELVQREDLFEEIAHLRGSEPRGEFLVFRYREGSYP